MATYTHIDILRALPGENFQCIVYGSPRALQRPRFFQRRSPAVGRPVRNHRNTGVYNPSFALQAEMRDLIVSALPQTPGIFFPEAVPLKLVVKFYMPRPENHFPRKDAISRTLPNFVDRIIDNVLPRYRSTPHLRTPDIDNMVKFVLDYPLQGVVYANDSFVTEITAEKMFDDKNECTGRTYIEVTIAE